MEPFHRYAVSRSGELPGVEIIRGHHSGPPAAWRLVPMVQLTVQESGSVRIWSRGTTVRLDPPDVVINAPNCAPRVLERLTPTSITLTASISPQVFDRQALAHGPRVAAREIEVRVVKDRAVRTALKALAAAIEVDAARPLLQAALSRLVGATLRAIHLPETRRLPSERLRPEIDHVLRLLEERFDQPVTLDELRSEVGLSKFHLLRLFREQLGTPPHAYQLQVRISHAREMLHEGATAAEVALRCGFADQAHFTRCFKRMVGYSPAAFARLG